MARPTNPGPTPQARRGAWLRAILQLADGGHLELRLPGAVAVSAASYQPVDGEAPSLVLTTATGARRRGRLARIFGFDAEEPHE